MRRQKKCGGSPASDGNPFNGRHWIRSRNPLRQVKCRSRIQRGQVIAKTRFKNPLMWLKTYPCYVLFVDKRLTFNQWLPLLPMVVNLSDLNKKSFPSVWWNNGHFFQGSITCGYGRHSSRWNNNCWNSLLFHTPAWILPISLSVMLYESQSSNSLLVLC